MNENLCSSVGQSASLIISRPRDRNPPRVFLSILHLPSSVFDSYIIFMLYPLLSVLTIFNSLKYSIIINQTTMIKSLLVIVILAISYSECVRIHHNAFTELVNHVAVPELFKKVDTQSQQFVRLAKEELAKINLAAGIAPSTET